MLDYKMAGKGSMLRALRLSQNPTNFSKHLIEHKAAGNRGFVLRSRSRLPDPGSSRLECITMSSTPRHFRHNCKTQTRSPPHTPSTAFPLSHGPLS